MDTHATELPDLTLQRKRILDWLAEAPHSSHFLKGFSLPNTALVWCIRCTSCRGGVAFFRYGLVTGIYADLLLIACVPETI